MPLFASAKLTKSLPVVPLCGTCKADRSCRHPKQTWPGKPAKVVFVVDKAGDDAPNALLDGQFGRLGTVCSRVGVTLDAYPKVPAAACPGASNEAWRHCQPLVASELARLNPEVVIPYGPRATQSVIGRYWQTPAELYDRWYGAVIPCRDLNAWICPVGLMGEYKRMLDVSSMFEYQQLRDAMRISGRPWPDGCVPLESRIRQIYDPQEINAELDKITQTAQIVAFDYETTGRKPEWDTQIIVSMAVAYTAGDELHCISFPVYADTHDAIRRFLASDIRKIAANMKFEDRWSRSKLGVQVRRWWWDTMQAAHWENPNSGVTGLKFQAFAKLGVPYFAGDVESYFESETNSQRNKILSVPWPKLLTYNGMDAIVELLLASQQMVENGIIKEHFVPSKYLPRK